MAKTYLQIHGINEHTQIETERGILCWHRWLPKSQVIVDKAANTIRIPEWLAKQRDMWGWLDYAGVEVVEA